MTAGTATGAAAATTGAASSPSPAPRHHPRRVHREPLHLRRWGRLRERRLRPSAAPSRTTWAAPSAAPSTSRPGRVMASAERNRVAARPWNLLDPPRITAASSRTTSRPAAAEAASGSGAAARHSWPTAPSSRTGGAQAQGGIRVQVHAADRQLRHLGNTGWSPGAAKVTPSANVDHCLVTGGFAGAAEHQRSELHGRGRRRLQPGFRLRGHRRRRLRVRRRSLDLAGRGRLRDDPRLPTPACRRAGGGRGHGRLQFEPPSGSPLPQLANCAVAPDRTGLEFAADDDICGRLAAGGSCSSR